MLKFLHRSNDTKKAPEVAVTLEPHTKKTPEVTVTLEPPSPSLESVSRPPSPGIVHVDDGSTDARGPLGLNLLHAPSEPLFDFVFVHGLGGGSRKTWSKTSSVSHYWPADWLPKDPAFRNVRIHSFGYDSDWTRGNDNCLNIHHFGKGLLGELSISPHIAYSNTSLVLIGHSMGGLVIKKAYMMACEENKPLADRIRAMYFLGTPHRGSDLAKLLKKVLRIVSSAPIYVGELMRDSAVLQAINDEFHHYSAGLELWSFYETQKLRVGDIKALVVEPASATLGYDHEQQIPMNADHRTICKFDTPADQNYIIIRNSLASTLENIAAADSDALELAYQKSIKSLATYLGVMDNGNDLSAVQDCRIPGTCEWILEKEYYTGWKDRRHDAPPVLWMSGQPGTGKSVLAGFVVDDLKRSNMACSYHFFAPDDSTKSGLNACLRSLVFQMASVDPGVADALLKLQEDRVKVDHENDRRLWRYFFVSGALRAATRPHYWVIDALDECVDVAPFLDTMLLKMDMGTQFRVLITSRETPELCRLFSTLQHRQVRISVADTGSDIARLVAAKRKELIEHQDSRAALPEKRIIAKSKGSFLWTRLVLDELSPDSTEEQIERVLCEMPRAMAASYSRSLRAMNQAARGRELAKAILAWVTCTMRPLTLRELGCALEMDLKERFHSLEDAIRILCGQFVTVDERGEVQMVHETARDFLLDGQLDSEFAIDGTEAHTRIITTCLEYLTSHDLKPPRTGKNEPNSLQLGPEKTGLLAYASEAFSFHLAKSDPAAEHVFTLLEKFLKLNVLAWIEYLAEKKNLGLILRTASDLEAYADSCMMESSHLSHDMQTLRFWCVNLRRLADEFADTLSASPSAIYSLIPSYSFPASSAIRATSTRQSNISVARRPELLRGDASGCLSGYRDFDDSPATVRSNAAWKQSQPEPKLRIAQWR